MLLIIFFLVLETRNILTKTVLAKKRIIRENMPPTAVGTSSYKEFVTMSNYFIDTTMLIEHVLLSENVINLITAPKKFGKTTNLQMIKEFLEIEVDERGKRIKVFRNSLNYKLFRDFKILSPSTDHYEKLEKPLLIFSRKKVMELQGKMPVVYIDLATNGSEWNSSEDVIHGIVRNRIALCMQQHNYLLAVFEEIKDDELQKLETDRFEKFSNPEIPLEWSDFGDSIEWLSEALKKHFKKDVMVLIDDYDSILNDMYGKLEIDEKEFKDITKFLAQFYAAAIKYNRAAARAVITGVTSLNKELLLHMLSLSNHDIFKSDLLEYFGVNVNYLEDILNAVNSDLVKKQMTIKNKYNGYGFGNQGVHKMLNPYSFSNYLCTWKLRNHWPGSPELEESILVLLTLDTFREAFIWMMNKNKLFLENAVGPPAIDEFFYLDLRRQLREIEYKNERNNTIVIHTNMKFMLSMGYLSPKISKKYDQMLGVLNISHILPPVRSRSLIVRVSNEEVETRLINIYVDYLTQLNWFSDTLSEEFENFQLRYVECVSTFEETDLDSQKAEMELQNFLSTVPSFLSSNASVEGDGVRVDEQKLYELLCLAGTKVRPLRKGWDKSTPGRMDLKYIWKQRMSVVEVKYDVNEFTENDRAQKHISNYSACIKEEWKKYKSIRTFKIILINVNSDKQVRIFSQVDST